MAAMRSCTCFFVSCIPWVLLIGITAGRAGAQTPLQTIDYPGGGKIVYGLVEGATTPPAAMAEVLRIVHKSSGEKPQVGQLFKAQGTNSVAVFFTVVDHPQGDKLIAGLLIAAPIGPNQVEAALLSDEAAHFGSSVDPMLNRLFQEWRPDGWERPFDPARDDEIGLEESLPRGPRLHTVTLSDGTAMVGLPDGWKLDPGWGGGTLTITGPHRERIGLNLCWTALDPDNPNVHQLVEYHKQKAANDRIIVYSYKIDPVKAFPEIFQEMRRTNGLPPTELHITHASPISSPKNLRCVHVTGTLDPDGKGICEMSTMMCSTNPGKTGIYGLSLFHTLLPIAVAEQERSTAAAIVASYRVNKALFEDQRPNPAQPPHDIEPIGWRAAQYASLLAAKNNRGLRKYILDQDVVDNTTKQGGAAAWMSMADALLKAEPNRYEIVNTPDYWKGVDY